MLTCVLCTFLCVCTILALAERYHLFVTSIDPLAYLSGITRTVPTRSTILILA